jgi:hypothetical protein
MAEEPHVSQGEQETTAPTFARGGTNMGHPPAESVGMADLILGGFAY